MKQPKALTREQKIIVSSHYMSAREWMLVEEMEFYYKLISKKSGKTKIIDKFERGRKYDNQRY